MTASTALVVAALITLVGAAAIGLASALLALARKPAGASPGMAAPSRRGSVGILHRPGRHRACGHPAAGCPRRTHGVRPRPVVQPARVQRLVRVRAAGGVHRHGDAKADRRADARGRPRRGRPRLASRCCSRTRCGPWCRPCRRRCCSRSMSGPRCSPTPSGPSPSLPPSARSSSERRATASPHFLRPMPVAPLRTAPRSSPSRS